MADRKHNNGMEHKQYSDSGMAFYNNSNDMQLLNIKRVNKMAQVKLMWLLCDFFGIPITLMGIISNIDNIKSAILAVLSVAYLCVRGYYYIKQKEQALRDKDFDLWNKEEDKKERMRKNGKIK